MVLTKTKIQLPEHKYAILFEVPKGLLIYTNRWEMTHNIPETFTCRLTAGSKTGHPPALDTHVGSGFTS